MPIWPAASVEEEPEIRLRCWHVIETERGEHHFVGQSMASGTGRVSSAITSFDPSSRIGRTRSGRRYILIGQPGDDFDGILTFAIWALANSVTQLTIVTSQYLADAKNPDDAMPTIQ